MQLDASIMTHDISHDIMQVILCCVQFGFQFIICGFKSYWNSWGTFRGQTWHAPWLCNCNVQRRRFFVPLQRQAGDASHVAGRRGRWWERRSTLTIDPSRHLCGTGGLDDEPKNGPRWSMFFLYGFLWDLSGANTTFQFGLLTILFFVYVNIVFLKNIYKIATYCSKSFDLQLLQLGTPSLLCPGDPRWEPKGAPQHSQHSRQPSTWP